MFAFMTIIATLPRTIEMSIPTIIFFFFCTSRAMRWGNQGEAAENVDRGEGTRGGR